MSHGQSVEIKYIKHIRLGFFLLPILRGHQNPDNENTTDLKLPGTLDYPSFPFDNCDMIVKWGIIAHGHDVAPQFDLRQT